MTQPGGRRGAGGPPSPLAGHVQGVTASLGRTDTHTHTLLAQPHTHTGSQGPPHPGTRARTPPLAPLPGNARPRPRAPGRDSVGTFLQSTWPRPPQHSGAAPKPLMGCSPPDTPLSPPPAGPCTPLPPPRFRRERTGALHRTRAAPPAGALSRRLGPPRGLLGSVVQRPSAWPRLLRARGGGSGPDGLHFPGRPRVPAARRRPLGLSLRPATRPLTCTVAVLLWRRRAAVGISSFPRSPPPAWTLDPPGFASSPGRWRDPSSRRGGVGEVQGQACGPAGRTRCPCSCRRCMGGEGPAGRPALPPALQAPTPRSSRSGFPVRHEEGSPSLEPNASVWGNELRAGNLKCLCLSNK